MSQPNTPLPMDVRTDETRQTGTITIYAEAEGSAAALRPLLDELVREFPTRLFKRGDIKHNIPDPPPIEV